MFACYDFNNEWYLIEMNIPVSSSEIDWDGFDVPDDNLDSDEWQVPYLEQYLNADGTQRLCELYDEPDPPANPARIAFFIFKDGNPVLRTPYGEFPLIAAPLPKRLAQVIEFEEE